MAEPNGKILCVDDHEDSCELLTTFLGLQGYQVEAVQDMAGALERIKAENFELLILDNKLPDGSGVDLCRKIRSFDKLTPIIFYSALASLKDREAGMGAGAQAYLTKPGDWDRLTVTVHSLVLSPCKIQRPATCLENYF
jgi:two-component system, OmpR family, response regulator